MIMLDFLEGFLEVFVVVGQGVEVKLVLVIFRSEVMAIVLGVRKVDL